MASSGAQNLLKGLEHDAFVVAVLRKEVQDLLFSGFGFDHSMDYKSLLNVNVSKEN